MRLVPAALVAASLLACPISAASPPPHTDRTAETERNRAIVVDFFNLLMVRRKVREAYEKYVATDYIQHNPNVPGGRQGFLDYFSKFAKPGPIVDTLREVLVSITAEGDRVVLVFKQRYPDPKDATKFYFTHSFDMLRIENGKIAEHWDSDLKR